MKMILRTRLAAATLLLPVCLLSIDAQAGNEGLCPPMSEGSVGLQPCSRPGPPPQPGHLGGNGCLVDEHQPLGVEVNLAVEPGPSALQDVGAVLLCRVAGLFLRVIPWRRKNRCSVP